MKILWKESAWIGTRVDLDLIDEKGRLLGYFPDYKEYLEWCSVYPPALPKNMEHLSLPEAKIVAEALVLLEG